MDNTVPESSINNISQKDEESSDEIEDDYCINESSDEEATSLTMYKSCNGTVRCKVHLIPYRDAEVLKTLFMYRLVQQNLF